MARTLTKSGRSVPAWPKDVLRVKDELNEEYPHLLPAWYAFRDARACRRAVEWLADESLIDDDAATRFLAEHTEPGVP